MSAGIAWIAVSFREQHPNDTALLVIVWMMAGFSVLFLMGFFTALFGQEELSISSLKISYCKKSGIKSGFPQVLYTGNITEISIKRDPKQPAMPSGLTLKSGDAVIRCGSSISKSTKHKFKKAVIAVLSELSGKDMGYLAPQVIVPES